LWHSGKAAEVLWMVSRLLAGRSFLQPRGSFSKGKTGFDSKLGCQPVGSSFVAKRAMVVVLFGKSLGCSNNYF